MVEECRGGRASRADLRATRRKSFAMDSDVAAGRGREKETSEWLVSVEGHMPHVAAFVRCVTHEPSEVADLLAETWVSTWCERGAFSAQSLEEAEPIRHARAACARWMAAHRREIRLECAGDLPSTAPVFAHEALVADAELRRACDWMRDLPPQQYLNNSTRFGFGRSWGSRSSKWRMRWTAAYQRRRRTIGAASARCAAAGAKRPLTSWTRCKLFGRYLFSE